MLRLYYVSKKIMLYTKAVEINKNWTLTKEIWTDLFMVQDLFIWYIDFKEKKIKATVRKGFETDFWSIPRIFWIFLNPTKYVAYILHDNCYAKKYVEDENNRRYPITRAEADDILFEALEVEWMCWIKRIIIWLWVRIWGWIHRNNIYERIWEFFKNSIKK